MRLTTLQNVLLTARHSAGRPTSFEFNGMAFDVSGHQDTAALTMACAALAGLDGPASADVDLFWEEGTFRPVTIAARLASGYTGEFEIVAMNDRQAVEEFLADRGSKDADEHESAAPALADEPSATSNTETMTVPDPPAESETEEEDEGDAEEPGFEDDTPPERLADPEAD